MCKNASTILKKKGQNDEITENKLRFVMLISTQK